MTRIVQLANFVTPTSGGLRTALGQLSEGYSRAGHDVVQVVPGPVDRVTRTPWGQVVQLRAPELPGTGYRVLCEPRRITSLLDELAPDRLEVHDRTTLRGVGRSGEPAGRALHVKAGCDWRVTQALSRSVRRRRAAVRPARGEPAPARR